MVDEYFTACTCPENKLLIKKIGNLKGKRILDIGCGAGETSVFFAKNGAKVVACDISYEMLNVAKKLAKKHQTKLETVQCYSHKTPFKNKSFDIVYAANLLHHVISDNTLKEINRILKDGGIFTSWDPLAHNFIINIYRKIAYKVRTDDERPIRFEQLSIIKNYFSKVEINTTWFFTLLIFIKFFFIDRINPNKERYWKKIIREHKKLEKTYSFLEKIDNIFLRKFPCFKRYCWNVVIYAIK